MCPGHVRKGLALKLLADKLNCIFQTNVLSLLQHLSDGSWFYYYFYLYYYFFDDFMECILSVNFNSNFFVKQSIIVDA